MKLKNIEMGDFVQIKRSLCHSEFKAKQVCEVIDIDYTDKHGFDVLIQGKNCMDWVNHKDLKKPKAILKQLDQSVFKGWADYWKFFAIDEDGQGWFYRNRPSVNEDDKRWMESNRTPTRSGFVYDTSNWRDSLIERDDIAKELLEVDLSKELTGSELCRAMLERGDKVVMCAVSDDGEEDTLLDGYYVAVSSIGAQGVFVTYDHTWLYATPINNQGEPLTASDVGI